jgi:hypothetical protein
MPERAQNGRPVPGTAGAWLALAAAAGTGALGTVELLFLLAPLAVVPVGFRLAGPGRWTLALRPYAALLAPAAFFLGPGLPAAALALPWVAVTALAGLEGLRRLGRAFPFRAAPGLETAGFLYLPVGGAALLAHRLGFTPLGFPEQIILLTAVHFHFTGFATCLLAAQAARRLEGAGRGWRALSAAVASGLVLGPPALAAGFVFSPELKLVSALGVAGSVALLAVLQVGTLPRVRGAVPRFLLGVSAGAVLAGMALAVAFEVGEFTRTLWLGIPFMAATHGALNGPGFALCGLLAWALERPPEARGC